MKKLMNKINFAIVALMASGTASMAADTGMNDALCKMGEEFGKIFSILQILAFVGAGVTIAGWAWGYISAGKIDAIKEVKEKGIAMLIGFFLLFGIGTVLSIFMGMVGENGSLDCVQKFF